MVVVYKKLGVVMEDHMEYCVAWMYVDMSRLGVSNAVEMVADSMVASMVIQADFSRLSRRVETLVRKREMVGLLIAVMVVVCAI